MRRLLALAVFAGGLFTLQSCGGRIIGAPGLRPDFVLLLVLANGMHREETSGALWGIVLGFFEDTFSAGLPGVNILTNGLLGFAAGSLRGRLDCDNPNTQAIVAFFATLLKGLVHLALLEVFSEGRGVLAPFLGTIAPAAMANGALLPAAAFANRSRLGRRIRRLAGSSA